MNYLKLLLLLISIAYFSCDSRIKRYDKGAQFIAIQPFEKIDTNELNLAKAAIEEFYGYDVTILSPLQLPKESFYEPKNRYRAPKLLPYLRSIKTDEFDKIIGMTKADISSSSKKEIDYPILAKSDRSGPASIVSNFRIRKYAISKNQFDARLRKVIIHEVGHTLGLSHCVSDQNCLMIDNHGSYRKLDNLEEIFCLECSQKLGWTDHNDKDAAMK